MKENPRNDKKNGKMYAYILDSISSDYIDMESLTDKQRIEYALDMFYKEKIKGNRNRMSTVLELEEWLSGLCSTVKVAFKNYDIANQGKYWGYSGRNGASIPEFVDTWFERIAKGILSLAKIYGVDMSHFRH